MIAGLEASRRGDVEIGGRRVNDLDPAKRDVAMVFQNHALFPHMSVSDNISFGMRLRGEAREKIGKNVAEVARMVDLQDHLHKRPGALSDGQRQRVALARAIVRKPSVFLFDEPLSNLDAEFRAAMRYELSRLHKQLGSTMIYVTHDQVEAMTMGDRIAVLAPLKQAGASNLMQFGTPGEVYHRPGNLFVAKFIGSPPMNFFEARVVDGRVMIGRLQLDLPASRSTVSEMTVGIRPEHVQINAQAGCIVEGTLESIENLGHEKLCFFATSIGRIITRAGSGVGNDALGTKFKLGLPWEQCISSIAAEGTVCDLSSWLEQPPERKILRRCAGSSILHRKQVSWGRAEFAEGVLPRAFVCICSQAGSSTQTSNRWERLFHK